MTIKEDIKQMFWEPAIDYASSIVPPVAKTDKEIEVQQEIWTKVHDAYGKAVGDVLEFIFGHYDVQSKELDSKYCQCPEPDRDNGYVYCQRCNKTVSDARMRFLVHKDEMFLVPAIEEDLEEIKRKRLRNDFEYNDMCARATLHPGKTIEEVKEIQFMGRIKDAYEFVNNVLCNTKAVNTKEIRRWVIEKLQGRLDYDVVVQCDETNNTPEIIDQNLLIARVLRTASDGKLGYRYVDMVFGEKIQVEKYQHQQLLDNETFKFIQKGI